MSAHVRAVGQPDRPGVRGLSGPCVLLALLILIACFSLSIGRFDVPIETVFQIVLSPLLQSEPTWSPTEAHVVWMVRMPRIALGGLIGAGLAVSGAALQNIFRNPLADSQILGVSSGAAFGGVIGIVCFGSGLPAVLGSFAGGLVALCSLFWLVRGQRAHHGSVVMLVLAGLVVNAVGSSGIAFLKYAADPDNQLPSIVFWLLGSLAAADADKLWIAGIVIGSGTLAIIGLRFHLSALSLGEEEAHRLGIPVRTVKTCVLISAALITAASVAVSGVIGWIGLVVPHLIRLSVGTGYRWFLINTMLLGATYLIAVDTAARTLVAAEIPLGALTAVLGAPIFAALLRRIGKEQSYG